MDENSVTNPEVSLFVHEFLQYKLSQHGHDWTSPLTEQQRQHEERRPAAATKVGAALRSLADDFAAQYKDNFKEMCEHLNISEQTVKPTVVGVANELFSEGIKWARIVAFFVFGSELATHCYQERNLPHLVNDIANSLSCYISQKLLPWINDHGGWEGLVLYNEGNPGAAEEGTNGRWPSVRNMLCLGISGLGALSIAAFLTKS